VGLRVGQDGFGGEKKFFPAGIAIQGRIKYTVNTHTHTHTPL